MLYVLILTELYINTAKGGETEVYMMNIIMKVSGDVFITSVNFAIKILQELLKDEGE